MEKTKEIEDRTETWKEMGPELNLAQLDRLEGDGVNIQCVNSSEFVVGKQTNFNGPVTIISCVNGLPEDLDLGNDEKETKEKEMIVVRGNVISKSTTLNLQEMAEKKEGREDKGEKETTIVKKNCPQGVKEKWKHLSTKWAFKFLLVVLLFLITGMIITLTILYFPSTDKDEKNGGICIQVESIGRETCFFNRTDSEECNLKESEKINKPVPFVVVAETNTSFCFSHDECSQKASLYQCHEGEYEGKHSCNFLIGGNGDIFEDRGWNRTNSLGGAASGKSLLLCLMGRYMNGDYATYPQFETTKALIKYGVENGFVEENYVLLAINATCIDDFLYNIYNPLTKWERFVENPFGCNVKPSSNESDHNFHNMYSKEDWKGQPATSSIEMKLPVPYVTISHTVTPKCYTLKTCSSLIRNMQSYHLSNDYADISYNFLVDSSGNIYEGRGWSRKNSRGGFILGRNLDVAFIGDYSKKESPTDEQFDGVKYLIEYGVLNGKISENYSLISANSTFNTLSPGEKVYEVIKTWPHFDPDPSSNVTKYD